MKPDKHKKKKSEQYMKKQNGFGGGSRVGNKDDIIEQRSQDKVPVVCGKWQHIESSVTQSMHHSGTSLLKAEVNSDAGTGTTKYHRRKVESNWEKYDADSGYVEDETMRGADYFELIQLNKNVLPEFQFDNFSNTHGGVTAVPTEPNGGTSKYLSLDCEMLSLALRSIPFCRRLDIDESLFDKSELEAFRKDASDQMKIYNAFLQSRNSAHDLDGNYDACHALVTRKNTEASSNNPVVAPISFSSGGTGVAMATTTTSDQCFDHVARPGMPHLATGVVSASEPDVSSDAQAEAPEQVRDDVGSSSSSPSTKPAEAEPTPNGGRRDSTSVSSGTAASEDDRRETGKPDAQREASLANETLGKLVTVGISLNGCKVPGVIDSVSLADLEDELDSLLAFGETMPAAATVHCAYG